MTNNDYIYSALYSSNPNIDSEFKANCVAVLIATQHLSSGLPINMLYAAYQISFGSSGFLDAPEHKEYVCDIVFTLLDGGPEDVEAFEGEVAYIIRRLNGERQDN